MHCKWVSAITIWVLKTPEINLHVLNLTCVKGHYTPCCLVGCWGCARCLAWHRLLLPSCIRQSGSFFSPYPHQEGSHCTWRSMRKIHTSLNKNASYSIYSVLLYIFSPEIIISMASVQVNTSFSACLCLPAVIAEILITLCFFYITQLYYPKFDLVEMNSFDYVWSKFVKSPWTWTVYYSLFYFQSFDWQDTPRKHACTEKRVSESKKQEGYPFVYNNKLLCYNRFWGGPRPHNE